MNKDQPTGAPGAATTEKQAELPADFWRKLQNLYESDVNSRDSWRLEEPALRDIVPKVASGLPDIYQVGAPLGLGGGGVVIFVDDTNLRAKRVLKISRPSPDKVKLLARVLQAETESLRRLSHQNLMRIFAQGVINHNDQDYPYYVMDFVQGVLDADAFLAQSGRTADDVYAVFQGILAGVEYLHEQETIHMDIKPPNILVTPACVPIISDLGFAKQLHVGDGFTLIGGTDGYIHPDARKFVEEAQSDPRRLRGQALRTSFKTTWDLYSLGKTFLTLLRKLDEHNPKSLTPYSRRYLRLLACRLLDGQNNLEERASGISLSTFREIKYTSVKQARIDLEKLTGSYNLEARIPELNLYVQDSIQVSTVAVTPFTPRVRKVLDHPNVMRLGSFSQLGLLNLVYPTATHSRLEHSLGTFSILCRYILALYNDPLNPLFRQLMDESDLRAGLLSALLHDVGQYPLAHDLEEADPSFSHEAVGFAILSDQESSLAKIIQSGWDIPVSRVVAILQAKPATLRGTLKDRILHSLINGPIDADKIDYLMRDSRHLGLGYGQGIDLDRLLRCLTVVFREQDDQTYAALGIHEKGKVPAEAIAFARYVMFAQVYWHHTYRSIKAMLHQMVWEMLYPIEGTPHELGKIRSDFKQFVMSNKQGEPTLFATPVSESGLGGDVCQVLPKDLAILNWIADRAGNAGKEFLDLLKTRRLYKRVLVLSREKAQDKELWANMSQFYHDNRRKPKKKLALQKVFQEIIVGLVERPPSDPPATAAITSDARNAFLVAGKSRAIVLVDFPPKREGSEGPVEYIIEEDRRRSKTDEIHTKSLEQSVVWKALQQNFHESIGKLRVFCHPDHDEFLSSFLTRPVIEKALEDALTRVEGDKEE